ncbi:MAG: hypothetical protein KAV41_01835 [Candidatus Pacebacteria bacterium]|nr:hypothetical protein [Candidatus Paceibacterota bacterium]
MNFKNYSKKISGAWIFLLIISAIYLILFVRAPNLFFPASEFVSALFVKIIPIIFLVFVLMSLANYFVKPQFILKHFREKGIKKWLYAAAGGIISLGPIYAWYPLLKDLRAKGLEDGLIACFLYNRSIKIVLLPLAIFYFGFQYVAVLCLVMISASIAQGLLINKLMEKNIPNR